MLKAQRAGAKFAPCGSLPTLFLQSTANQLALEFGKVIDEKLAFEMIHLMLDADGEQPIRIHFEARAVAPQCAYSNIRCARQLVVDAGQRQAALFAGTGTFLLQQLWIDQYQRLIARLAHIEHDQSFVYVDLSGGETDALGRVHGLEQIVRQLTQCVINHRHRCGLLPQPWIGILQDYELCHGSYEINIVFLAEECC